MSCESCDQPGRQARASNMSVLVNVQVYCSSLKITLSLWQITSPHPPNVSFLYLTILGTLGKQRACMWGRVRIYWTRLINLAQVVATYGSYVKLVTREPSNDTATATSEGKSQPVNTFEVMFASQRRLN